MSGCVRNAATVSGLALGPDPAGCGAHAAALGTEAAMDVVAAISPMKADASRLERMAMDLFSHSGEQASGSVPDADRET
jgi:hypothetical protein